MGFSLRKKEASGSEVSVGEKSLKKAAKLAETKNWYQDRYQLVVVQRNILFMITALALAGLGGSVWTVAKLSHSKTFEPYIIEIDKTTGITTTVPRNTILAWQGDEALIRYFLVKYIKSRESYDPDNYRYNYAQTVRLLSSSKVYNQFRAGLHPNNPDSPINLGRSSVREAEIRSISFREDPQKVMIRIAINDYAMPNRTLTKTENYLLLIGFEFLSLDLSIKERYINPLGFQIISYRKDREENIK